MASQFVRTSMEKDDSELSGAAESTSEEDGEQMEEEVEAVDSTSVDKQVEYLALSNLMRCFAACVGLLAGRGL